MVLESFPPRPVRNSLLLHRLRKHTARWVTMFLVCGCLTVGIGCVDLGTFLRTDSAPKSAAVQLVVTWHPEIASAPDTVHGGRPVPGLAGRLYIFGPDGGFPLQGDGTLVVDLYCDPAAQKTESLSRNGANLAPSPMNQPIAQAQATQVPGSQTQNATRERPLEEWRIDRESLKKLEHRDAIGLGYTLFLPWEGYKPELNHVRLRVCYVPVKGTPLYLESPSMKLKGGNGFDQGF